MRYYLKFMRFVSLFCGNAPIDESPDCYKPAKDVISAVVKAGLARVAYTLTPIASLKGVD